MSQIQTLRSFVNERLSMAVEEIFVVVERILTEYEDQAFSSKQQIEQQQRILDVLTPDIRLHQTEFQHRPVCEEVSPEHQERNPSLVQEEPESPQIKEEQELLQSPEEAVGSTQTLLAVKHEDDGENSETEPLASTSTEHMETQYVVEDCGTSQPTSDDQLLSSHCSESESDTEDSDEWEESSQTSQSDTEDSDEWEETSQASKSAIKTQTSHKTQNVEGQTLSLRNKKNPKSSKQTPPMRSHIGGNIFICTLCGKVFGHTCLLKKHMRMHTAEKPFTCTVCGKSFCHRVDLKRHARSHTGEKPFACLFCNKGFSHSDDLEKHKKLLTCTI